MKIKLKDKLLINFLILTLLIPAQVSFAERETESQEVLDQELLPREDMEDEDISKILESVKKGADLPGDWFNTELDLNHGGIRIIDYIGPEISSSDNIPLNIPAKINGSQVTSIADEYDSNSLEVHNFTSLRLPDGLKVIEKYAFSSCENFKGNLILPDSLEEIGLDAFTACKNFTGALILPSSLISIGNGAFAGCSGFTSLEISKGLKSLSEDLFFNCSGFKGDLIIPDNIEYIKDMAFENCSGFDGNLKLGDSILSIGNLAFDSCSGLKGDLIIPDSVLSLGQDAFKACSGFDGDLILGKNLETIGNKAFMGARNLRGDLIVPDKLVHVSSKAFKDCSGFDGDLILGQGLIRIDDSAFENCSNLKFDPYLPDSLEHIASNAFKGCNFYGNILVLGERLQFLDKDNMSSFKDLKKIIDFSNEGNTILALDAELEPSVEIVTRRKKINLLNLFGIKAVPFLEFKLDDISTTINGLERNYIESSNDVINLRIPFKFNDGSRYISSELVKLDFNDYFVLDKLLIDGEELNLIDNSFELINKDSNNNQGSLEIVGHYNMDELKAEGLKKVKLALKTISVTHGPLNSSIKDGFSILLEELDLVFKEEVPGVKPPTKPEIKPVPKPEIDLEVKEDQESDLVGYIPKEDIVSDLDPETDINLENRHLAYLKGYPDQTIRPDDYISREEVSTIIYRLAKDQFKAQSQQIPFKDLNPNRWSYKYIEDLSKAGIIKGYEDNTFRPEANITRAEAIKILVEVFGLSSNKSPQNEDFKGHWAESYIMAAIEQNWIEGYEDGSFRVNDPLSRAEFTKLVNRAFDRCPEIDDNIIKTKDFTDLLPNKWYYKDMIEASKSHDYSLIDGIKTWKKLLIN